MKSDAASSAIKLSSNLKRAPLTMAIVACLSMGAIQPASAGQASAEELTAAVAQAFTSDNTRSKAPLPPAGPRHAFAFPNTRPPRFSSPADIRSTSAVAAATPKYVGDPGRENDPDSWTTEEFQADWGLVAIGANYAYARGLTGLGVTLGSMDTGTLINHPEFAGSGRIHPVQVTVQFDGSTLSADGGIARLLFGDHGTHTAGTIAATRDGSGMHGVAFNSHLYAASGYALDKTSLGDDTEVDVPGILDSVNTFIGDPANYSNANGQPYFPDSADLEELLTVDDMLKLLPSQWVATPFDTQLLVAGFNSMTAQGVRVINNSWGSSPELGAKFEDVAQSYEAAKEANQPWFNAARDAALNHDVLFVFAAGNESGTGDQAATVTHAGLEASLPAFIPELADHWVSVVAVDNDINLTRSDFSNICGNTKEWCISAPGSGITSTGFVPDDYQGDRLNVVALSLAAAKGYGIVDGTPQEILEQFRQYLIDNTTPEVFAQLQADLYTPVGIDLSASNAFVTSLTSMIGTQYDPLYVDKDGTSMATPHVTGALGLLFERFPYLTGTQVRDVMFTTATDLGATGVDEVYGWGMVDLEAAINGPGMLRYDTVVTMNQAAGGLKVWQGNAWDDWSNNISGPGRLFKDGAGWLRLSGDNTFAGASVLNGTLELDGENNLSGGIFVTNGQLILNGSLLSGDLQIEEKGHAVVEGRVHGATMVGGWLGGNGVLGDVTVAGTVAPGDTVGPEIGTLYVSGAYFQQAGSFYTVDLSPNGASDLVQIEGTATLEGGTVVPLSLQGSRYVPGQSYRILSATGGVSGVFSGLNTGAWNTPFLAFDLIHSPFAVDLGVSRGASFASVGRTWNQLSTGEALDDLDSGSPLLLTMLQLNTDQAVAAFDQLSGELYPSVQSVLVESSRMQREAVMQRARAGSNRFTAQAEEGQSHGLWAETYRSSGHLAADGNARRADHSSHAVLAGYDHRFDGGWRLGAMLGSGRTDLDLSERSHEARSSTRHAGIYGGGNWGGFGLRAGLIYAHHKIDAERQITFADFSDQTYAEFDASTLQSTVEAGYRFAHQSWEFEPFLQYANVRVKHDAIEEAGGNAALHGPSASKRIGLSTLGARFNANLRGSRQENTWLSLQGSLGYQHASGDLTPSTNLAFIDGDAFNVRGAPIAKRSVVVEAGFAARLTTQSIVEFGYSGQIADEARDHGVNARLSVNF